MLKVSKLVVLACVFVTSLSFAAVNQSDKDKADEKYFSFKKTFVTNYGGAGKLKYFSVKVSLQVENAKGRETIELHTPLIRNTLTMFFAKQSDANIKTAAGQERLRQDALKEVQQALIKEVKNPVVQDILFSSLNYQE